MEVLATVGLPGSGKGAAADVAAELGVPVVTMGDVIRAECRDRGLDPATHHGEVAQALRDENGPGAVAERSLPMIEDALEDAELVLVDGIRSDVEVERFRERFGEEFSLVSIEAPYDLRRERIAERGRDKTDGDGDGETLRERDERELGFGMGAAMEMADVTLDNTDTLESLEAKVRTLLTEGVAAYRKQYDTATKGSADESDTTNP